jgi:antitoxin CptB
MTGSDQGGDPGSDAWEVRRRRLRFRCWHRGTREMDLLLGRFADEHLAAFTPEQIERLESLLEEGDPDLYNWATGRDPIPAAVDTDVMRLLKEHVLA